MGKWTLDYHDDVLRNKLKSIITGACKRTKLEKGEPSITYEAFVEELDEGDSFTVTLIDFLVKELADRRTRPNPIDRRLISERSAKGLRFSPLNIYRSRTSRHVRSRSFNPSAHYPFPDPLLQSTDDEDELDLLNGGPPMEGVRVNTELYDAYGPGSYHIMEALPRTSEPSPLGSPSEGPEADRETVTSPRPVSPPLPVGHFRNSFWGTGGVGSTTLSRQNSIRRPIRSRTVDFNDFTSRRRSTIRQNNTQGAESLRDDEPTLSNVPNSSNPLRRFMPLPWTEARRRTETLPPIRTLRESSASPIDQPESSSQLWYSLTNSATSARPAFSGPIRPLVAPRLRRGGLRAPESMLSRYASPLPENPSDTLSFSAADEVGSGSPRIENSHHADWEPREEIGQLLTPRSISPVGEN